MKYFKLIIALIFCSSLIACSKDSNEDDEQISSSEYYISFEVNNQKTVYTTVISASINYNATLDVHGVSMMGAEANTALAIYLFDTVSIGEKTYTGGIIPNKYISSALISYASGPDGFTSAAPNISPVANASVTITEINDVFIAGEFHGLLVSNSDYNTVTHTIENGKFKLKFESSLIN